uniref:(northern house mosquito) hypothetical protein n=1 Tax=Culex pipiens TaxID=7175 RepID=A0A8D8EZX1_CULPI
MHRPAGTTTARRVRKSHRRPSRRARRPSATRTVAGIAAGIVVIGAIGTVAATGIAAVTGKHGTETAILNIKDLYFSRIFFRFCFRSFLYLSLSKPNKFCPREPRTKLARDTHTIAKPSHRAPCERERH